MLHSNGVMHLLLLMSSNCSLSLRIAHVSMTLVLLKLLLLELHVPGKIDRKPRRHARLHSLLVLLL